MKYIRTKDGRILPIAGAIYEGHFPCVVGGLNKPNFEGVYENLIVIKQADTIEKLICEGDLVRIWGTFIEVQNVVDTNDNTYLYDNRGFNYNIKDIIKLYIKQSNEDYKLVAKKKTLEGELELL